MYIEIDKDRVRGHSPRGQNRGRNGSTRHSLLEAKEKGQEMAGKRAIDGVTLQRPVLAVVVTGKGHFISFFFGKEEKQGH